MDRREEEEEEEEEILATGTGTGTGTGTAGWAATWRGARDLTRLRDLTDRARVLDRGGGPRGLTPIRTSKDTAAARAGRGMVAGRDHPTEAARVSAMFEGLETTGTGTATPAGVTAKSTAAPAEGAAGEEVPRDRVAGEDTMTAAAASIATEDILPPTITAAAAEEEEEEEEGNGAATTMTPPPEVTAIVATAIEATGEIEEGPAAVDHTTAVPVQAPAPAGGASSDLCRLTGTAEMAAGGTGGVETERGPDGGSGTAGMGQEGGTLTAATAVKDTVVPPAIITASTTETGTGTGTGTG